MKNPPILLLDEATSALDNESEILVGQSLDKLAKGRTTLTIAHRLTTIQNADRILVLGKDGIEEEGSHAQLLSKKGIYYRLWNGLVSGQTLLTSFSQQTPRIRGAFAIPIPRRPHAASRRVFSVKGQQVGGDHDPQEGGHPVPGQQQ